MTPPCPFTTTNCNPISFYYYTPGIMFHGSVGVANGTFQGKLTVPIDALGGARGRVRAYLEGGLGGIADGEDGVGAIRVQVSPGVAPLWDQSGPRITLSFTGQTRLWNTFAPVVASPVSLRMIASRICLRMWLIRHSIAK